MNRAPYGMAARAPQQGQREVNMKFKVVKVVGKGSYGTVYQVQRLSDGKTYALKEMDVRAMSQAEREDAANEIRLLASVQHPNVVSYNEAFLDGNRICIIMDYAPDGDLSRIIKKHLAARTPMPNDLAWKLFIQICAGLSALHKMRILHRDIKPGNIMMSGDVAKIGDLGIAKLLSKTVAAKTQIGTPHYMPPEIWKNRPYGFQSDTWAVGCLLYELLTLKVPFEARNINELRTKVTRGVFPPMPASADPELVAIVKECLQQDPARRPTLEQLLTRPSVQAKMGLLPVPAHQAFPAQQQGQAQMIDTIKVPRNFQMIKNKLPPAQYEGDPSGGAGSYGSDEEAEVGRLPAMQPKTAAPSAAASQLPRRVAQAPLPPQLMPGAGAVRAYGQPASVAPSQQQQQQQQRQPPVDPVVLEMQRKAAAIGNVYNMHMKQPPPSVAASVAAAAAARADPRSRAGGAAQAWYMPQKQVSESRAAYGAFYHSPQQQQQQQPQYKGYYYPGAQKSDAASQAGNAAGARGGAAAPANGRLRPLAQPQPDARSRAGNSALASKPPPWNYGVAQAQSRGVKFADYRAGYDGGAAPAGGGGANYPVSRYPPAQWNAPRAQR